MIPIDHKTRVAAVASSLRKNGADAYVGTRQAALHYLGGVFMPWRGAVIVTAAGTCDFVYWALDADRARRSGNPFPVDSFVGAGMSAAIVNKLKVHGVDAGRIGLDLAHPGSAQVAPGILTAQEFFDIKALLPRATLENGVDYLDGPMLLKDAAEVERLRAAAHVADAGFQAALGALRLGVTENSVAGAVEKAIRDRGSTWAWSVTGGTEVGFGERTAFSKGVTQESTEKRLERDQFVIVDLHPLIDLYMADLSIPIFFGTPTREQRRLIDCWEDVVKTIFSSLKPGRAVRECVELSFAVFAKHDLGEYGLPMFGHGLGTDARTRPFMNSASEDQIQTGMVIALGTHLYYPGLGGMRLEYPTLIMENGAQALCQTPAKVHFGM